MLFRSWLRARRERVTDSVLAQHLDRRLQLQGLLVSAIDGAELEPAWQQRLAQGLEPLPTMLPRVRWRELGGRPLAALLLAAAVALWPQPAVPLPRGPKSAGQATVARLTEELLQLQAAQALPEELEQELQQQLKRLMQQLASGDPDVWRAADEIGRAHV
mgnify:CR=1 FL=1